MMTAAWGPWVVVAFHYALKQGTWVSTLPGVAAAVMTILAGFPPLLPYVALPLAGLWIYHVTDEGRTTRAVVGTATRQLATLLAGGALVGVLLLVFASQESGISPVANSPAFPGAHLPLLLFPNLLGEPGFAEVGFWGGTSFEAMSGGFASLWAITSIGLALRLKQRATSFYGGTGLAGLALSLFVPPSHALFLVVLGLAGLSALVVTRLQNADAEARHALVRPALRLWLPAAGALVFGSVFVLLAVWSLASPALPNERLWHMANATGEGGLMLGGVAVSL
jgi:uncharacterized membrane protein YidH (DUF202 family)